MVILKSKHFEKNNNREIFKNPYQFLFGVIDPPHHRKIKEAIETLLK
jgi:hypothetical protein